MTYALEITATARKQMKKLPAAVRARIREKLDALCIDPFSAALDVKKLQGRGGYRLRIGDYRAIYELENNRLILRLLEVGHRREIYH